MSGIPSGNGTEVLKRVTTTGDHDSAQTILTVTANHIYTILNISICNNSGSDAETFYLYMTDADNSNRTIYLTRNTALSADATFVWNDKFVLRPADTLRLTTAGASDLNILVSYIDQDWS